MSILQSIFRFLNRDIISEFKNIPGPTPSFPLGNLDMILGKNPWEVTSKFLKEYGPIAVIWFGNSPNVVINSPELFKEVLDKDWLDYYKDSPVKQLKPVITPYTPFIANQPYWKQMRKNNPFSSEWFPIWLKDQVSPMFEFGALRMNELQNLSNSQAINLTEQLQKYSFDAFSIAVVGKLLPKIQYSRFCELGDVGSRRLTNPLILPFVLDPFFYLKRKEWLGYFENEITNSLNEPNPSSRSLISYGNNKGVHIASDDLTGNTAGVFYGGVYSVTSVLASAIWFLSQPENSEYEKNLILELKPIQKLKNLDELNLEKFPLLHKVLLESLRIFPAVPFYSRNSSKEAYVFLGGHRLPKDTQVIISNYALHRLEEHWHDAEKFEPNRWDEDTIRKNPLGSDYFFPFGKGPRACMGMPFAMTFLKTSLAMFYSQFKFIPDKKATYEQGFHFGVMMPKGIRGKIVSHNVGKEIK
ncbi:MAG: cytochrome P450 [Leptospiraceae bacterium]|nr:cytochrome P450 [Leptospiraceae bacterium]